jgi:hypothetical protein
MYVVSLSRSPVRTSAGQKKPPRGGRQRVPLYGVKWDPTSARPVTLNPECMKEHLNEPWDRFQICGSDVIPPIICYGNVQRSTVFVDALQRSSNRKSRGVLLFASRCSHVSKPQTDKIPEASRFSKDVSSCQRISMSVPTKCAALLRVNAGKSNTKPHTAGNVKHSVRTVNPTRLRCEEMRLIFWNGDPYPTCRRNRTGLLDPTSK